MPTYEVAVVRTEVRERVITVEAADCEQAEKVAKAEAALLDYAKAEVKRTDYHAIPLVDLPVGCFWRQR
jgi:hypothetical protein